MLGGYVSREPEEALSSVRSRPFLWMNREHPDSEFTGKLFVEEARDAHELFSSQEIGWDFPRGTSRPSGSTILMSAQGTWRPTLSGRLSVSPGGIRVEGEVVSVEP